MLMILSACGGNNNGGNNGNNGNTGTTETTTEPTETTTEPEPEPVKEAEPVKLRVFSTFGGTDPAREAFQKVLDEFTAAHPNVTIDNEVMSANDDGFRTKVSTDLNSGNEPDILFYFTGADADDMIKAGKVVPMDDLLAADAEWKGGLIPSALEAVRHTDGKIYGIPLTGYYEGLFVNKALFEKYSLELPTDWEKFKTAVKTFADNGVIPLSGPFDQSHYIIEHFVLGAAGSAGQAKGLIDGVDPNWEKGYAAMKEIYDLGGFPKDAGTIDLTMAGNYYSQGLAAMVLEGSWALGGWDQKVKDTTTVFPFPAIPGGAGTGKDVVGGFGSGFYLSKKAFDDAAKKDTALALLKHLTTPASIQAIAQVNGGSPAADVEITGLPQAALDGFKMVAESTSINSPIDSKVHKETFTTLRANVAKVVKGDITPAEALAEAQKVEVTNKQ
nr:extracellular solute-binding protein [Paenibacillus phyllosphaerae]